MYDDKKRHRTAFSEATIPPCRHWRYACCMTLRRRETLCTMSSSCCCRQRCRGFFLGSYGTAVALSWIEPKVSTGRHQSLTHSTLRTPPRGFVIYGLSLWERLAGKGFYRSFSLIQPGGGVFPYALIWYLAGVGNWSALLNAFSKVRATRWIWCFAIEG